MIDEADDRTLLSDLANGERRAFDQLYHRYWEALFRYVARVLKDEDDTADVLQDTFFKVWEQRERLLHVESLKAYLFTMARNGALRFIALQQNHQRFIGGLSEFLKDGPYEWSAAETLAVTELQASIDKQIMRMPPRMREVFLLSRFDNLSNREIATRLNISENTVKKQINYALKIIRLTVNTLPLLLIRFPL
ncbi:MAG TPA: RNA polymerase sigma-70 factor [Parapedobacter sp.]|nr:RNA polymerase sigma-70 factor [Parapedobacter sp.]